MNLCVSDYYGAGWYLVVVFLETVSTSVPTDFKTLQKVFVL